MTEPFVGLTTGPALDTPDRQAQIGTLPSGAWEQWEWLGDTTKAFHFLERGAESVGAPANRPFRAPPSYNPPADLITAEEAEKKYGITGRLGFKDYTKGISDAVAQNLYQRALEDLRRRDIASRAPPGIMNGLARFGVGLLSQGLDPLDMAANFIPVVGEARYAKWLAEAGGALERTAIHAGVGAARGAVGNVPIVAMQYGIAQEEQADYSSANALLDLAYGAGLGAIVHTGIGRFTEKRMIREHNERLREAATEVLGEEVAGVPQPAPLADAVARAPLEVREGALRSAIAAAAEDRPVESGLIFAAHEASEVTSLPVVARRDIELLQQEQELMARAREIGPEPKALTREEEQRAQEAAEKLARVQQVEEERRNPLLTAEERTALSERRDELLTDTTPEKLAAEAAVLEERRTSRAQWESITERLQAITDERTRNAAAAALSGLPRVGGAVEIPRDLPQEMRDLLRGAGQAVARETVEGLSPELTASLQDAVERMRQRGAELAGNADQAVKRAAEPPLGNPGDPLPDPQDAAVQRAAEAASPKGGPRTGAKASDALKEQEELTNDTMELWKAVEKAGLLAAEDRPIEKAQPTVIDAASIRREHGTGRGDEIDAAKASAAVTNQVREALANGQRVVLYVEGKGRPIVGIRSEGEGLAGNLVDEKNQPWGPLGLLFGKPGDHDRIEINPPEPGRQGPGITPEDMAAMQEADAGIRLSEVKAESSIAAALCLGKA